MTYKARTRMLTRKSWPGVSHKLRSCMHVYVCQGIVCVFLAKLRQMFVAVGLSMAVSRSRLCVSFTTEAAGPSMDESNTRWTHKGTVDAHKWRPNISLYYS